MPAAIRRRLRLCRFRDIRLRLSPYRLRRYGLRILNKAQNAIKKCSRKTLQLMKNRKQKPLKAAWGRGGRVPHKKSTKRNKNAQSAIKKLLKGDVGATASIDHFEQRCRNIVIRPSMNFERRRWRTKCWQFLIDEIAEFISRHRRIVDDDGIVFIDIYLQ